MSTGTEKTLGQIAHEAGEQAGKWERKWPNLSSRQKVEWEEIADTVAEHVRATPTPQEPVKEADVSDAEILALNENERFFSESPTKYPEAGHGTQYHAGAPGVLAFARAVRGLRQGTPEPPMFDCVADHNPPESL